MHSKRGFLLLGLALLTFVGTTPAAAASGGASSTAVQVEEPAPAAGPLLVGEKGSGPVGIQGTWTAKRIPAGEASCPDFYFCMWDGLGYSGAGLAIGGSWLPCEAVIWQDTRWENRALSVKNNASAGVSIWNRRAGGGFHFDWLFDLVRHAYSGDFPAGRQADLLMYDPNYTCSPPVVANTFVVPPGT